MKRDFREEYNNYIESDMPDLWSRIEPNLKEKVPVSQEKIAETAVNETEPVQNITDIKKKKQNKAKIYRFVKIATPVAAGICLLVIGVGVMGISEKSMEAAPEADASASEYECTEEFVAEESYDYVEESAEVEENYEYEEEAVAEAPMEEFVEDYTASNGVVMQDSQDAMHSDGVTTENADEEMLRGEDKEIAGAILIRIAKASQSEKEVGFAYIYVFRLEDGSNLEVYVTDELCGEWEETDSKLQRQKNYLLTLESISDTMKQTGDFSAEYVLQEAIELP